MHQTARRPVWQGRALAIVLLLMVALVMFSTLLTATGGQVQHAPRVTVDLSQSVGG